MISTDLPVLTEAAAVKIKVLIAEEGNPELRLRVFVSGSGSSGFKYGFTFDQDIQDGDTELETEGVKLLIDPLSCQYLIGAEIDYKEGPEGSQFVIRNPNDEPTPPVSNTMRHG